MAADVRRRNFHVPKGGGNFQPQLFDRGVLNLEAGQRAASNKRIGERKCVDDLGAHPRFNRFGGNRKAPASGPLRLAGDELVSQNSAASGWVVPGDSGGWHFGQAVEGGRFDRHTGFARDGDKAGQLLQAQRMHSDNPDRFRQLFKNLSQFDAQHVSANGPLFESDFQGAGPDALVLGSDRGRAPAAAGPLENVAATHIFEPIALRQRHFELKDTRALDGVINGAGNGYLLRADANMVAGDRLDLRLGGGDAGVQRKVGFQKAKGVERALDFLGQQAREFFTINANQFLGAFDRQVQFVLGAQGA